jgi:S-adenosylmethionine hydrolase
MKPIALLTDFGLADHFVGVMKGVIARIAPSARVIDISHEIPAYSLTPARFLLTQSWRWFPDDTVFVCVVDPGVGSQRRAIAVRAGKSLFLGPDNGLLSDALRLPKAVCREITNRKLFAGAPSATFHGRDIFAPVAAHLAKGLPFGRLGPLVKDATRLPALDPVRTGRRFWSGEVVYVDRFGNCITNLPLSDFPNLAQRPFLLRIGLAAIDMLSPCYAAGDPGQPILVAGSHGFLEVAANQGHAAKTLGVAVGSPVEMEMP